MSKLVLKTEPQIVGGMARTIMARTGLNDLNPGSLFLTLAQAAAKEDFAQYYQMLQIVRNYNLDTTTGSDLDNRAFEFGLTRTQPKASSGRISILREDTFVKISATFYTGFRSRISGDTEIFVNNAVNFPTSGPAQTLIIGRGTPNEEEVNYTPSLSNPQNNTNYFTITLDTPLSNDHALDETIILKQGTDTFIPSGTILRVPASGRTPEITFNTTVDATILAGEDRVDDVNIACLQPGTIGNIGVNSLTGTGAFASPPFTGARAINDSALSNGLDKETDTSLRNRIKAHIQALSQSTTAGIKNAIAGLVDPSTAKRVVSSNIILPDNVGLPVKIYIDDGTGFEPDFNDQGEEIIVQAAQGQETRLQLDLFPIVKAQVETLKEEPYNFSTNGLTLIISVGTKQETITFFTSDFSIAEAATAEEIVKVINNASGLVEARTAAVGKKIVLSAKTDVNEDIQILGGTANSSSILDFPTDRIQTFYLYKNDKLLSKDGDTAFIDSGLSEPYDFSGPDRPLSITIDGKTANIQTATIHQSDFPSPAAAAAASAQAVADIINAQIAGATAISFNGKLRIISNTELSASSKIKINTSLAQAVLGFSITEVVGRNKDYTLNPELGVIELNEPLVKNDLITAGTRNSRAFLTASIAQSYTFSGGETLDIQVDGGSTQTITFSAGINRSAQDVADIINAQLVGGSAVTRTVGLNTFLEIRTNTLNPLTGSLQILSSSTGNSIFGFELDSLVLNIFPHTAFSISTNSGPYAFVEGNTLVVVMDNDNVGKTAIVTMSYGSKVTSGTSTTQFGASSLTPIFPTTDSLKDFWTVFKSGLNTITGPIDKVENPTIGTFRYFFKNPAPTNFQDFLTGDQASFSGMNSSPNNGNFLITNTNVINVVHNPVITKTISNPASLTPSSGDRYLVNPNANTVVTTPSVITKTRSNPFDAPALTPSPGDAYIVAAGANNVQLAPVDGFISDSNDPDVQQIHGKRYLIGIGVNDWAGHNHQIAQYNGVGTPGWIYYTPSNMDVVFVLSFLYAGLTFEYDSGAGNWLQNPWGGKAGKIATWNGSAWIFTTPLDKQVRLVTAEAKKNQYDLSTNTWTINDWGGNGNQIAQWNGSAWIFEVPAVNDTVLVSDESKTYQYTGTSWILFQFWVEVANSAGLVELSTASGTGLIGQRRQVLSYNGISGAIVLTAALRSTPVVNDNIVILPGTRKNVVTYFNNTKVTSLSTKANIELAQQGSQVQISSKLDGSDGFVQVTGGKANQILQFTTSLQKGLRAYSYYIGLIKLVHSTIYGDEKDLTTFPGVGGSGIKFIINGPTVQEIPFAVSVKLAQGLSLSSVENDIKTQIISYVSSVGVAQPIILANIIEAIMGLPGIVDVSITSPTANVAIAQNEKATTKASVISVTVVA